MNIPLLQRRRLLCYFGLGFGAATVGVGLKKAGITASTTTSGDRILPHPTSAKSDSSTPTEQVAVSPTKRSLPEFQGINQWLNSAPVNVADLKGKVVLVQFWTFACINCQRTLPYITRWHQQYVSQGLRIVGVHTPEFPFEQDINNVKAALKRHKITYPIPLDNEYKTWQAYQNQYWPHLFLADRQGILRYDHIGEGAYEETEQTIRRLLG
jgi:thiol-disulfide isomerase/thioredoxin